MDELIRLCRKAANDWRNNDAYYQAAVLIDSLCDRLEKTTEKPQTNADRIRAMSDEELAWELMAWRIETCARLNGAESPYPYTQKSILDYLKQPVKDGDNDG